MRVAITASVLTAGSLFGTPASADEGQWPLDMLDGPGLADLKSMGLKTSLETLRTDVLPGAVNYSGCSAGFVSEEGLVLTNHHCAYPAIQANSSAQRDLLASGFVAKRRADELPAKGRGEIDVIVGWENVSSEVLAAMGDPSTDAERATAAERAMNAVTIACEADHPGERCQVFQEFFGESYKQLRTLQLRDVRLVYAPPSAVGEFGGEIDNWQWPRHSGDFALLRAYVGPDGAPADYDAKNVPYRPSVHLKISTDGVGEGDFVMTTGWPGRTDRYWPSAEVDRYVDQVFPAVVALYQDWVDLLDRAGSRADAIKVAASKKGLANRLKNARGMLAGLERMKLVARKRAQERRFDAPELLSDVDGIVNEARTHFARSFLLDNLEVGPNLLATTFDLGRLALELGKPDVDRDPRFTERNRGLLMKVQDRRRRDYAPKIEAVWLGDVLLRLKAEGLLPDRMARVPLRGPNEARRFAAKLLQRSKVQSPGFAARAFAAPKPAALAKSPDPLVRLGLALARAEQAANTREEAIVGGWMRVMPGYLAALRAQRTRPLYPDANRSFRVSFAHVRGYIVEDGLQALPQTTLSGQIRKHTGEAPFDLPESVRRASKDRIRSRWADRELGDVPMCFLATGDTTGGNSGSPVLDAQGRLVGLNFDRVWENIAGDFAYNLVWSRNISVDVRYLLWTLDSVEGAPGLLREMGVLESSPTD